MNFKNILKGAAIASAAILSTSCASDYLDTPVYGALDASDVCKTTENARQAVLAVVGRGMQAPWSNLNPFQSYFPGEEGIMAFYGEVPGSDCYANYIIDSQSNPGWAIIFQMQDNMLDSGDYVWSTYMWTYCYTAIAQLNDVIAGIDGAEGSEAEREFTKAQAHALRAHFYYRLLQLYAPRWEDSNNGEALTVVLRVAPGEHADKEVSTMNEVLAFCYNDLNIAIDSFTKAGSYRRSLTYEPTLNIAYGIYARVAALKHDWATVKTMAHNARQGYRLATTNEAMSGYMSFNDNEWMWSPSFMNPIDNYIYGNWCAMMACNSIGANNYNSTMRINIDLYNQIPENDIRREWFLTSDKMDGIRKAMFYLSTTVSPVNQRFLNANMIRAARTWLDEHQAKYNIPGNKAYDGTGSGAQATMLLCDGAQAKFWCDGETGNNAMSHIPYMRATEMWLYEAEACAELGETALAQSLLNEINQVRNAEYNCTASGQALIDEVRLYRRIELWGEGSCWFDLKRWNLPMERRQWQASDQTSGNMPADVSATVPTTQNSGWRYGIPPGERNYNTSITQAVPGVK